MLPAALWLLCLTVAGTRAQTKTNEFYSTTFSTLDNPPTSGFASSEYTFISPTDQSTVNASQSSSNSHSTQTSTPNSLTLIGGHSPTANGTASSTSTVARASNTVPCNGYHDFCNRQYSNITNICSHNSAYVVPNNAGSNQVLPIVDQLNDGVRMRKLIDTVNFFAVALMSQSPGRDSLGKSLNHELPYFL